jgi:hypothetical protein
MMVTSTLGLLLISNAMTECISVCRKKTWHLRCVPLSQGQVDADALLVLAFDLAMPRAADQPLGANLSGSSCLAAYLLEA